MDKELIKVCGICGDKALGYNFNAITCESCKAFFRRNALKNKEFKCPFDGNCKIDLVTRRFCQRCRLKKCFDIGMKKEWILSDEEKQVKRSKIMENRKRKHDGSGSVCTIDADSTTANDQNSMEMSRPNHLYNTDSQSLSSNISSDVNEKTPKTLRSETTEIYNSFCDSLIKNSYFDESQEYSNNYMNQTNMSSIDNQIISISTTSIAETSTTITESISKTDELNDIPEIVYRKAIEMEFASIPMRIPIIDFNFLVFNELETNKLNELFNASLVLRDPLCRITSQMTGGLDALKMSNQVVQRLIKMSKRIQAFKSLCQTDQMALIKGGCTELIVLQSIHSFNYDLDYFTLSMDNNNSNNNNNTDLVNYEILTQVRENVYEVHKRFMHSLRQEWHDSDQTILDLLIAITLFSSERPNLTHKEMIKVEQQSYMYLLQRYLEIKYRSKCEAKSKFLRFLTKLEELHILNEQHIRAYLETHPNHFEPLLLKILDLKH